MAYVSEGEQVRGTGGPGTDLQRLSETKGQLGNRGVHGSQILVADTCQDFILPCICFLSLFTNRTANLRSYWRDGPSS